MIRIQLFVRWERISDVLTRVKRMQDFMFVVQNLRPRLHKHGFNLMCTSCRKINFSDNWPTKFHKHKLNVKYIYAQIFTKIHQYIALRTDGFLLWMIESRFNHKNWSVTAYFLSVMTIGVRLNFRSVAKLCFSNTSKRHGTLTPLSELRRIEFKLK